MLQGCAVGKPYTPYRLTPSNYQCRTADPMGLRFAITHMRWASCPYHLAHRKIKNRLLGDLLFDKWHKRPTGAYKLYWRTHPKEDQEVKDYFNNLKKPK